MRINTPTPVISRIDQIIADLQQLRSELQTPFLAAQAAPDADDDLQSTLRQFLKEEIARSASGELTTENIVQTFAEFRQSLGLEPLPDQKVQRSLTRLMWEIHKVPKSHNVSRGGKHARGFRCVKWVGC